MNEKVGMEGFVNGNCEAVHEPKRFINNWLKTDGKPCSVCGTDKSKCRFYQRQKDLGSFDKK
jgi:hypothetical protein